MPKRSAAGSSDIDVASSSDIDVKPALDDDTTDSDVKPSPKKLKTSPKKVKSETKPKQVHKKWSADEDAILFEIIEKSLWQEVKHDGRLEYRGGSGVKAHWVAIMRSLKKA